MRGYQVEKLVVFILFSLMVFNTWDIVSCIIITVHEPRFSLRFVRIRTVPFETVCSRNINKMKLAMAFLCSVLCYEVGLVRSRKEMRDAQNKQRPTFVLSLCPLMQAQPTNSMLENKTKNVGGGVEGMWERKKTLNTHTTHNHTEIVRSKARDARFCFYVVSPGCYLCPIIREQQCGPSKGCTKALVFFCGSRLEVAPQEKCKKKKANNSPCRWCCFPCWCWLSNCISHSISTPLCRLRSREER